MAVQTEPVPADTLRSAGVSSGGVRPESDGSLARLATGIVEDAQGDAGPAGAEFFQAARAVQGV